MSEVLERLRFSTHITRSQFLKAGLRIVYARNFRWIFLLVGALSAVLFIALVIATRDYDLRIFGGTTISTIYAVILLFKDRRNLLKTYDNTLLSKGQVDWLIGLEGLQLTAGEETQTYAWAEVALVDINRSGAAFLFKNGLFLLIHQPGLKGSPAQKKLAAWMRIVKVRYEV
jgi:hypothetical protein